MKDNIWNVICSAVPVLRIVLTGVIILSLLSVFALLYIPPNSGSYYLTIANLSILIPLMGFLVLSIWRCSQVQDVEIK